MERTFSFRRASLQGLAIAALMLGLLMATASAAFASHSYGDGDGYQSNNNNQPAYALNTSNQLLGFDASSPDRIQSRVNVTGLKPGEKLLGIDFRPANGQLYGLGSTNQIYVINYMNGVATAVGAPFTPALAGSEFGFDFNPVVDRIRIVSDADQNLRVHPDTGQVVAVDGSLNYAAGDRNFGRDPNVTGVAYSNPDNDPNTGTVLYDIDFGLDILATQNPPNSGTLNTTGRLGVDTGKLVGFDIGLNSSSRYSSYDGSDYQALAALQPNGSSSSRLYSVDLGSGSARDRGRIGYGEMVRALAINLNYSSSSSYSGGGSWGGYGGY